MPQNEPLHHEYQAPDQDRIPSVDCNPPVAPGAGSRPPRLSPTAMAFLRRSLARQQRRRAVFQGQSLRVCVDGETHWQMDPRASIGEVFRIPLEASCLEIFGDDDEGPLLLALLPLPKPEALAGGHAHYLGVTLEGGQTIAIDIALERGSGRKRRVYVIQLGYANAPSRAMQSTEPSVAKVISQELPSQPPVSSSPLLPYAANDSFETRLLTEAQLFAEIRWVQVQAKELSAVVQRLQEQTEELRKTQVDTKRLRSSVQDKLQRLRELCQESPWVRRGEQEGQDTETPNRDA